MRLEVSYSNKEGEEHSGSFDLEFSAKSFGPGCNSAQAPRLTLTPTKRTMKIWAFGEATFFPRITR